MFSCIQYNPHTLIMNCLALLTLFAALAYANAGIILPSTKVIQGPSTKTTLAGPDGSVISSESLGGQVVVDEKPQTLDYAASVAAAVPLVKPYAASSVVTTPLLSSHAAPLLANELVTQKPLEVEALGSAGSITTAHTAITPHVLGVSYVPL